MKHKALRGLRIVLGVIIVLVAGGGQRDGFSLVVQQIQIIGPRQWLGLMAGSIIAGTPGIAPLTERIARSLPTGDGSDPYGNISVIYVG
jgi:hypothetical protein